ncbi:transcription factor MYC2-like [Panicum virgatum]|uniref:BHLH domain-containing protein n=1 Tax=Panicum virgatum TaxID=38727 RepID=A0A8T0UVG6_PANVG|nr:transcription factor MYC2-like [Panicum virgatum]KAG2625146.1 hypothetical protein PVAP13_3KG198600 [Panicum virgatum]
MDGGGDYPASFCGDERSRGSALQQEQDLPITEEQLQQIYLLMDMEEQGHAEPPPSSQSSTFPAASFSASPDEASSLIMPGSSSLLDTIPNLEELIACQEGLHGRDRRRNGGHDARGAFMPYSRHLSTRKRPKPGAGGAGGQRAIKAAMSALARMHMARLAQWQRYQMEMAAAVAPPTAISSDNQLQHVLSERKRREKLNDSFKALKAVLPPAPKKDKASILIRARDYVNTLKSRLSELEERNRRLVELMQRQCDDGGDRDDVSDEKIEVDINRAAAADETSHEFHLKIVVRSGCNAMDAVVAILECLKELGDVRLAAADTGRRATTLALQMKTSGCDDNFLKESVIKNVKGVMQSKIETA